MVGRGTCFEAAVNFCSGKSAAQAVAAASDADVHSDKEKPPLLRAATGHVHQNFHETTGMPGLSREKSRRSSRSSSSQPTLGRDTSKQDFVSKTPLLRGYTNVAKENEGLVGLLLAAMKDYGWKDVGKAQVKVKDKSGEGGSKTYRATVEGCTPESVALHSRSEEVVSDPLSEPRMEAASQLFAANGLAPRRIVQGPDWFIEVWEGMGQPKFDSDDMYKQLAQLVAAVHKLPRDWYDEWRKKLQVAHPFLQSVSLGSHIWWYAARPKAWLENVPKDCREMFLLDFCAPETEVAKRLVTTHGDLHAGNLITVADGSFKCIDFEFSCVSSAVMDLSYTVGMMEGAQAEKRQQSKRIFLQSYLQCMGDPDTPEDIDNLLVDVELGCFAHHFSPCSPMELFENSNDEKANAWKAKFEKVRSFVNGIRGKAPVGEDCPYTREQLLEIGMIGIRSEMRLNENLETGRLMLVSKDSPHRCVFEHAEELRTLKGGFYVPLTLTSHPGLAIAKGPKTGPHSECGCHIYHEELGIGPASHTISVRFDEFLHECTEDSRRVFDIEEWELVPGTPVCIWNKGPSFNPPEEDCPGQRFQVNEDGTISPKDDNGLVLGASQNILQHALQIGRVMLVPADSPHRCVFEHAEELKGSEERVPLTLVSHRELAVVKGPKRGPITDCGCEVFHEELGIGLPTEAISVKLDGGFLRESVEDSRRVLDIEDCEISAGTLLGIFNEGPSFIPPDNDCKGQRFQVNENGTISPDGEPTLVLGASRISCEFDKDSEKDSEK